MNKLLSKMIVPLTVPELLVSSFSLSSCEQSSPDVPVIIQPSITFPVSEQLYCEITNNHTAFFVISGFKFEGISDLNLLKVTNTFKQGKALFVSSVTDWNPSIGSFSVEVMAHNVVPSSLSGTFQFTYDGQPVECHDTGDFAVQITEEKEIVGPTKLYDEQMISKDNTAEFTFGEFHCLNMPQAKEKLKVTSTFWQESISFDCSLEFTKDDTFSIKVKTSNIHEGNFFGEFVFTYDGEPIEKAPTSTFQLIAYIRPEIFAAPISHQTILTQETHTSVQFDGFRAVGLTNLNDVSVKSSFEDSTQYGTMTCSLVNWNPSKQSFSVQVDIDNPCLVSNLAGDFTFSYKQEEALKTQKDYFITMNVIVPYEYLNTTKAADGNYELLGLKDKSQPIPTKYNVLQIPSYVARISNSAFEDVFTDTLNSHIEYLNFPDDSILTTIGTQAFKGDTAFRHTCTFPILLSNIGENAFYSAFSSHFGCHLQFNAGTPKLKFSKNSLNQAHLTNGLTIPSSTSILEEACLTQADINGELYIPRTVRSVGRSAFYYAKNVSIIDLSEYTDIPEWVVSAKKEDKILEVMATTIHESKVYLNPNLFDSTFKQFAKNLKDNCALPSTFEIIKKPI